MNLLAFIWSDPRFIYPIAVAAVVLLFITIWLFRRPKRSGRQAGIICLMLSILAHIALLLLVPLMGQQNGGSPTADQETDQTFGIESLTISSFDSEMNVADVAGDDEEALVAPLPMSETEDLVGEPAFAQLSAPKVELESPKVSEALQDEELDEPDNTPVPDSLVQETTDLADDIMADLDDVFGDILDAQTVSADESALMTKSNREPKPEPVTDSGKPLEKPEPETMAQESIDLPSEPETEIAPIARAGDLNPNATTKPAAMANAPPAFVPAQEQDDFANRVGEAKDFALNRTGGSADTEAAVQAALKFIAGQQQADGSWSPTLSSAGVERAPLGENRGGAGRRATTAITGLSLLALLGSGNTHHQGEYSDNVYRGLAYLIHAQKPDGSLAGNATIYASTYSHGMAALAMCEAAAITQDESALVSARRAIAYTNKMQHPTTGGWRYTPGDPGDLSQLGWQAMVLDAGHRAKLPIDRRAISGVQRFIRSVRAGRGGLATYRPGEAPSRTMTAEALATRLLVGDRVPQAEVDEATRYLLQQAPGSGQDNYYYWYYATLALHQLQDESWERWNSALKSRLLATQRSDGSWPTTSVWGGYGGSVYTTSMGALCLESYYRHTLRSDRKRVAEIGNSLR